MLLTELGREQANLLAEPTETYEKPQDKTLTLLDDIFEDIIGHDDIKELLTAALLAEKAGACIASRATGTCQVLVSLGYRASVWRASDMACWFSDKQSGTVGPGGRTRATDFACR